MLGSRNLLCKCEQIKINKVTDEKLQKYATLLKSYFFEEFKREFSADPTKCESSSVQMVATQRDTQKVEKSLQSISQACYLRRVYQQAKQVSQIIAYIWRWIDDDKSPKQESAKKLKEYFVQPTPLEDAGMRNGQNLEKLLGADILKDSPIQSDEVKLLREVFPDYQSNKNFISPIFDDFELGNEVPGLGYELSVDINSYQGNLSDTDINHPYLFIHSIPYPPRPELSEATVTRNELEVWIENRVPDKYYADNPYIPTTST